jgi:hypothetical protein
MVSQKFELTFAVHWEEILFRIVKIPGKNLKPDNGYL